MKRFYVCWPVPWGKRLRLQAGFRAGFGAALRSVDTHPASRCLFLHAAMAKAAERAAP